MGKQTEPFRWPHCPDCGSTDLRRSTTIVEIQTIRRERKGRRKVVISDRTDEVEEWTCICRKCGAGFVTGASVEVEDVEEEE